MSATVPDPTPPAEGRRADCVLAGVDIGTLTCRLLIARVSEGRLTELRSDRRILRLGEGVHRSGRLLDPAIDRVIDTLTGWRESIHKAGAQGEVVVATSAVRDAANRDEFVRRVKQETGFDVEVLTGQEEARRTMLGIRSGLAPDVGDVLGLDIGGGSTEFILDRVGEPTRAVSIDIGVVRLTEATFRRDPPRDLEVAEALRWVRRATEEVRGELGPLTGTTLVGTAGTMTTLAAMDQRLAQYEPARIQNYVLGLSTVLDLERLLRRRTRAERRGLVGLEPGREDVIVAGTLILRGVMEAFGFDRCLVSDVGLREGIVLDLAARLRA